MADTFGAISSDPQALKDTIAKSPSTLAVVHRLAARAAARSWPTPRPGRATSCPPHRSCARALPDVNGALEVGTPVLRRSVELNDELQGTMTALRDLAQDPGTNAALFGLNQTVGTAEPAAALPRALRHGLQLLEHVVDVPRPSTSPRAIPPARPSARWSTARRPRPTASARWGPPSRPTARASCPARRRSSCTASPTARRSTTTATRTARPGQRGYLEAPELARASRTRRPASPSTSSPTPTRRATRGRRTRSGSTASRTGLNTDHVPAGETFSREPQTGPQLDPRLTQP